MKDGCLAGFGFNFFLISLYILSLATSHTYPSLELKRILLFSPSTTRDSEIQPYRGSVDKETTTRPSHHNTTFPFATTSLSKLSRCRQFSNKYNQPNWTPFPNTISGSPIAKHATSMIPHSSFPSSCIPSTRPTVDKRPSDSYAKM